MQFGASFYEAEFVGVQNTFTSVSQEDWKKYDEKIELFYQEYQNYIETLEIIEAARARSFFFDLWLENNGKGLATDVDVNLVFPEVVPFVGQTRTKDCDVFEKKWKPPLPPEEPVPIIGIVDYRQSAFHQRPDFANILGKLPGSHRDEWHPYVSLIPREDNFKEIHIRLGKLKHGDKIRLGSFMAFFSSAEDIQPFGAEFTISSADLTTKISNTLSFIVRRKTQ